MKGIIMAGGLGSTLHPLTKTTNKHLLPVGSEPMLYHPIHQLVSADIEYILILTSTRHMGDIVRCLGSCEEFGLKEWDISAEALSILGAGRIVSNIDKSDNYMRSGSIVAENLLIFNELKKMITACSNQ